MPSCALRYCLNNSRNKSKSQGVTFHQFPQPRHEKRETWIQFVQKNRSEDTWLPTQFSRICSVHFIEDEKYTTKTGRVYLKKSAVPCDNPKICGEPEVSEQVSHLVNSLNSICSTQKEIELKNKLRKESAERKKLTENIKIMRRQNISLRKKCNYYKRLVKMFKHKLSIFGNDLKIKSDVVDSII